jgi:hypothetical protein
MVLCGRCTVKKIVCNVRSESDAVILVLSLYLRKGFGLEAFLAHDHSLSDQHGQLFSEDLHPLPPLLCELVMREITLASLPDLIALPWRVYVAGVLLAGDQTAVRELNVRF